MLEYLPTACVLNPAKTTDQDLMEVLVHNCEHDAGYPLEKAYNSNGSYLLLRPARNRSYENIRVVNNKFYLIQVKNSTLVFQEQIAGGTMLWISPEEIEIFYPSGFPGEGKKIIYDVRSDTKRAGGKTR